MPNWCENELKVEGDKKLIDVFVEVAKSENGPLSLNQFVPYPKCFQSKKLEEKYRSDGFNSYGFRDDILGGYNWCILNWGTKWDLSEVKMTRKDNGDKSVLIFNFDTAWSPPTIALLRIASIFKKLNFTLRFWECGNAMRGIFQVKKGKLIKDDNYEYKGRRGG